MSVLTILDDKQLKAKSKVEAIGKMLLNEAISVSEVITFAQGIKDKEKGICIEAMEFATKVKPAIASLACLEFVTEMLTNEAPTIKRESARVIGNIAHLYPNKLDNAISNLLTNSEYPGTVVRWSAAYALGEIVKLKTGRNEDLIPAIESIINREDDNAIKKIYQAALKKAKG